MHKPLKKIAILINWTREIDFYNEFIKKLNKDKFDIIVNDIKTFEEERKKNSELIIKRLKEKKFKYFLFSQVYGKTKYEILISTGLTCPKKISPISILKYIYGKTIGSLLEISKLNLVLIKFFGKPFTGGGCKAKIYGEWFPEKKLGDKVIFFPRGMDLRLNHFPNKKFEQIFDIFLCHGKIDKSLIENKFKNKKNNLIIGYPRYDEDYTLSIIKHKIFTEFKLNQKKKVIFWCPTYIEEKNEISKNIDIWIDKISPLTKDFNVILRPHPKNLVVDQDLIYRLKKTNLFIDQKNDRKLLELYVISDLVLVDNGGSVLSSVYLKKNFAILELPSSLKFIERLRETRALDYEIKNELDPDMIMSHENNSFDKKINFLLKLKKKDLLDRLKEKYFGSSKEKTSLSVVAKKLEKMLTNE